MQTTVQAKAAPHRGRAVGLALALLLQAGFVYALVTGLNITEVIRHIPPTDVFFPPKQATPPNHPVNVRDLEPDRTKPIKPDIVIDTGDQNPDRPTFNPDRPAGPGPADHGPLSVVATHTIPPYPPMEQRLGHEGTVLLRLTISATGVVTDAQVIRSSGYERLDEAAAAWVKAHWRYRPAMRGGAAVPATGNVSVTFNLRTGG